MSITLDLKPEVAARAHERAAAQGMAVTEYLETVLEQALPAIPAPAQPVTLEEFDRIMDELAEGSENLTVPAVISRAELDEIALHCSRLPVRDARRADEVLGYDERGLPT